VEAGVPVIVGQSALAAVVEVMPVLEPAVLVVLLTAEQRAVIIADRFVLIVHVNQIATHIACQYVVFLIAVKNVMVIVAIIVMVFVLENLRKTVKFPSVLVQIVLKSWSQDKLHTKLIRHARVEIANMLAVEAVVENAEVCACAVVQEPVRIVV
jgi:hypothetical protein